MNKDKSMHLGIALEASALACGEGLYTDCPSCGRKGKFSVSVTDDGTILYNCFRASCALHGGGAFPASGKVHMRRVHQACMPPRPRPYRKPLFPLTPAQTKTLKIAANFSTEHCRLARPLWAKEDQRYAFPIVGPSGGARGYSLRSYNGQSPKALIRMDQAGPSMSYYGWRPDAWLIVVEDIPSAVRAARYVNAVALCGTRLNPEWAGEIAAHHDKVVFALDADATAQSIALQHRYRLMFKESAVLVLPKDLKDMEEEELARHLAEYAAPPNKKPTEKDYERRCPICDEDTSDTIGITRYCVECALGVYQTVPRSEGGTYGSNR